MWIDSHCHPFSNSYSDKDAVVERAFSAGVDKMISVSYNKDGNRATLLLSKRYPYVFSALGIHPCECKDLTLDEIEFMKKNATDSKVVAIGEIGLDYFHNDFSPEVQKDVFVKQIRLAKELDLPCIIHSRDAAYDTLKIMLEEGVKKAVFHCYTYDLDFARVLWDKGYYTSFTGIVTYPKSDELRLVVANAPNDLFFIETDCPYLPPQSKRGQKNEMAYVIEIGLAIAKIRGVTPDSLAQTCKKNVAKFFEI